MKKFISTAFILMALFTAITATAQKDKSKRPSPPATATQKVGDATVTINYSQPSVKGRTIGKDLEPMEGQVWRTGANEATTFETDKDIMIEGKALPKGKYALFTLKNGNEWTIIFNKTWNQWGAYDYKEADDALRVKVTGSTVDMLTEKLLFTISTKGEIVLLWGNLKAKFNVTK